MLQALLDDRPIVKGQNIVDQFTMRISTGEDDSRLKEKICRAMRETRASSFCGRVDVRPRHFRLIERALQQINQIRNRFQGIIDLVCNGVCHAAGRSQPFTDQKSLFRELLFGRLRDNEDAAGGFSMGNDRIDAEPKKSVSGLDLQGSDSRRKRLRKPKQFSDKFRERCSSLSRHKACLRAPSWRDCSAGRCRKNRGSPLLR